MLSLELQRYNTRESICMILYEYIRICDVFWGGNEKTGVVFFFTHPIIFKMWRFSFRYLPGVCVCIYIRGMQYVSYPNHTTTIILFS
jgi:hypothetical protein